MANIPLSRYRGCPRVYAATLGENASGSLRDLLQESDAKPKHCANPSYVCTLQRLENYDYCIRHILRDPRANYRQCTFVYTNGRKCPNAVLKHDAKKEGMTTYCFQHSRQMQLQKTQQTMGKFRRIESNESLMQSLVHHLNVDGLETPSTSAAALGDQDEEIDVVSPHVAPFVPHDQVNSVEAIAASLRKKRRILDYASESDTEDEPPTLENLSNAIEWDGSDDESVDSELEDPLKHAGVYTRQEAVRISEAKLTRLQGLYIEQINRLHHTLKDRRRRYLQAIRKEREMLCSIHDQLKDTSRERQLYDKFKALNSYHRRHGVEAVLYKKYKEKRSRAIEGYGHKAPSFVKCIYTEGGVKCGDRAMPCCKYCRKHIMEDKKQVLYRSCGVEKSAVVCQEPTPCVFDDPTCVLHLVIPSKTHYYQKKYESETEDECETAAVDIKQEVLLNVKKSPKHSSNTKSSQLHEDQQSLSNNVTIAHESPAAATPPPAKTG